MAAEVAARKRSMKPVSRVTRVTPRASSSLRGNITKRLPPDRTHAALTEMAVDSIVTQRAADLQEHLFVVGTVGRGILTGCREIHDTNGRRPNRRALLRHSICR